MARDDLHFRLRIPEALKAAIAEAAERNKRSMTAEMISRLEDSFSSNEKRRLNQYGQEIIDIDGKTYSAEQLMGIARFHEVTQLSLKMYKEAQDRLQKEIEDMQKDIKKLKSARSNND